MVIEDINKVRQWHQYANAVILRLSEYIKI